MSSLTQDGQKSAHVKKEGGFEKERELGIDGMSSERILVRDELGK